MTAFRLASLLALFVWTCGRTDLIDLPIVQPVGQGNLDAGPDAGRRDAGADGGVDAGIDAGFVPKPCIDGTFSLKAAEPVVMLVLDKSGSMDLVLNVGTRDAGITRWDALVTSLRATLPKVDQTMEIGGLAFPAGGGDQCTVSPVSGIWPARGNVPLLLSNLSSILPSGPTPTLSALEVAAGVLRGRRAANSARVMVLATDGEPTCTSTALRDTLTALRQAAADGIPTYVIGVDDDASLSNSLQAMADAGSRPRQGAKWYYSAKSVADLELAFSTIRDEVGACSFLTLSVPDQRGAIKVTFGGADVPEDPTGRNGWRWTDRANGELILFGPVCASAIARPANLVVSVSCGGP